MKKLKRMHHQPKKVVDLRNRNILKSILSEDDLCDVCLIRYMSGCSSCMGPKDKFSNFTYTGGFR